MSSNSETPPDLQPTLNEARSSENSTGSVPSDDIEVSDLLLRILSRLTVYQALQETGGLVASVREDIRMMDACCLFLPSATTSQWNMHSVEVCKSGSESISFGSVPESPGTRSKGLWHLSKDRIEKGDVLFGKALEEEANRATSAFATDQEQINPVGDYLCLFDLFVFVAGLLNGEIENLDMTVAQWIELKRGIANGKQSCEDEEWKRFCERSVLVTRASICLSEGLSQKQVTAGSSMNLSSSNLLRSDSPSTGSLAKQGGSSLTAVSKLLSRPWQHNLPLTVVTEKGIQAIFSYINLTQLMAHVCFNCSEKLLEPFFRMPLTLAEFDKTSKESLSATPLLDLSTATVNDALEVLGTSQFAILVSKLSGCLKQVITPQDILEHISVRMDRLSSSGGSDLPALGEVRLMDLLASDHDDDIDKSFVIDESDFPLELSHFLHRILLSKTSCMIVVAEDSGVPIGVITVRDVWNYVMQGTNIVGS